MGSGGAAANVAQGDDVGKKREKLLKKLEKLSSKEMDDEARSKKLKKVKRKLAELGGGENDVEKPIKKIKKKKGKSKKSVDGDDNCGGTTQPSTMAEVGNLALAQNGPSIVKNCYKQSKKVSKRAESEIEEYRKRLKISMSENGRQYRPVFNFDEAGFPKSVLESTKDFSTPSPIQSQCWPVALSGRDIVAIAATGSGKTFGFGLPALTHILNQSEEIRMKKAPIVLVIAPTRELAAQIEDVLSVAGKKAGISTLVAYGGVPKYEQARALKKGVGLLVVTPGRLLDLVNDGSVKLDNVSFFVLDEADRMLDLGFLPDIRRAASLTRSDRQTLMFSATWPSEVQLLAKEFLADPARVTVGGETSKGPRASKSISQIVEVVEPRDKDQKLQGLLKKYTPKGRILLFVLYKKEAARVEERLNRTGWKCASVHGDKRQELRTKAVNDFKAGRVKLLVATDVAARGLDIPDVEVVINFTFPLTIEDYVHRIGRTGRAGKLGISHTFFTVNEKAKAGELQNVLREAGEEIPDALMQFGSTVKKKESKLYGAHFKEVDMTKKATKITFDSDDD